jgi:hypothetical protein
MKKIRLSENHARSVSSSLRIVEKHLDDLERELHNPDNAILYKSIPDISETEQEQSIHYVREAKKYIQKLAEKYHLTVDNVPLSRKISSSKSGIWVILGDSTSGRLKGYGEFPREHSREFDDDISRLQELVRLI